MIHFDKVRHLQMALMMQGIEMPTRHVDLFLTTLKVVKEKEGKFSIDDAVNIQMSIDRQYPQGTKDPEIKDDKTNVVSKLSVKDIPTTDLIEELAVRNITVKAKKTLEQVPENKDDIDVTQPKKEKRHYTIRKTKADKKTIQNPEPDPSLSGNMLGAFLRKAAIVNRLTALGLKYGAGTPMRMRTLIFKHGNPDLLHTDIGLVSRKALLSLPRTGPVMWEIFCDIRDFAMPKEVVRKDSFTKLKTNDLADLEKVRNDIESNVKPVKEPFDDGVRQVKPRVEHVTLPDYERDTIASAITGM
jgi:hypothetical protein